MLYIKEVLLQLLFALVPFVLYNIYYRNKTANYSKQFITITCMICLFMSMTFHSSVLNGIIFDIRYVIMFFGMVFGGMTTGLILLVEFLSYRILIGGKGLFSAMIILVITFNLSVLLSILYRRRAKYRKLITFLAGLSFSVIPICVLFVIEPKYVVEHLTFNFLALPIQNSLGIWLLISLFNKAVSDKQLFQKYLQNEKVETIAHVAASLAHEVRNPLTAVMGFLKLIRNEAISKEKTNYYIDICVEEMKRTEVILSEYLSIAKPSTPIYEQMDLVPQLNSVIDIMTPYANMNNVALEVHNEGQQLYISANPNEIKQLLINFIKNAIEACSCISKGKVIIRMAPESRISAKITIHDNGVGLSNEQLERLGTIYFSTKSKGTGVGLTLSYQLIRSMNGAIHVRSTLGKGTEFVISLPLTN
ncbi:sensor histidine kinase [Paenibacillus alginolyticus]|uniref:histidine kinase n=1 Tax=Paenibacillus alginolyticus TaxID=59839 RepID=A0ABT4G6E8_9BACL|nr:HAMP domain-containing sensor histidine kinase [Paenibacillus alginolyticus]MCY9691745.1 HAMP domain-containing histidine kinase [Paenibacillus alginolyticus]MEC0144096.1 HAMP domain-containing sensor histidine kinase [Paenibacillus alginolyticus]